MTASSPGKPIMWPVLFSMVMAVAWLSSMAARARMVNSLSEMTPRAAVAGAPDSGGANPDAVAANFADERVDDFEIGHAFFEDHAAGAVVVASGIESAAIGDDGVANVDVAAAVDEDREAGDFGGFEAGDFEALRRLRR